jgi:hypothetical protein
MRHCLSLWCMRWGAIGAALACEAGVCGAKQTASQNSLAEVWYYGEHG